MYSTNYSIDNYFCVGSKKRMKKLSRHLQTGTSCVATALTEPFKLYALSLNRWIPLVSQMEAGEHLTQNAKCFPLLATLAYKESQWATDQMHFVTFHGQGETAETTKWMDSKNMAIEFRTKGKRHE